MLYYRIVYVYYLFTTNTYKQFLLREEIDISINKINIYQNQKYIFFFADKDDLQPYHKARTSLIMNNVQPGCISYIQSCKISLINQFSKRREILKGKKIISQTIPRVSLPVIQQQNSCTYTIGGGGGRAGRRSLLYWDPNQSSSQTTQHLSRLKLRLIPRTF